MQKNDDLMMEIAKQLLQSDQRYLEFGLAIEEAVESLRRETTDRVKASLADATRNIASQYKGGRGWSLTENLPNFSPQFFRRFYRAREKKNKWHGIRIEIWTPHREPLKLVVCAQGWPEENSVTAPAVEEAFTTFVQKNEKDLWTKDSGNQPQAGKVAWHLNADQAFLIKKLDAGQMLSGLVTSLMDAFDKKDD